MAIQPVEFQRPRWGHWGTVSELRENYPLIRESCVKFERWE